MDFDADGKTDILSGCYPGDLFVFKGQGGSAFAPAEKITHADGKPVKVGLAAVPFAQDWDADGDLDLLVGDIEGQIFLVPNEGTKNEPKFGKATLLKADDKTLKVDGDAGPTVADWDGDGTFDLIAGTGAGSVVWFRNTGTARQPQLAAAQVLVPAAGQGGNAQQVGAAQGGGRTGLRTKVHATDWNGDGRLDLLVGDFAMDEVKPKQLSPEQEAAKKARQQAWMAEYNKVKDAPDDETPEARKARMAKIAELIANFRKAAGEDGALLQRPAYHGYVWVYLRQDGVAAAQ